ncbi:hypothetical protein M885DRAFT_494230 [Pelagophyceae sp. CCMP2097]|nr:hypothetical protein M885DRAFT_494230 [Pelagophyceae sp. CCMP2097]
MGFPAPEVACGEALAARGVLQANDLLDAPEPFPFEALLAFLEGALAKYIDAPLAALKVYDAFTLHYDKAQAETTFNQHRDPSFVTVNICLERQPGTTGSQIEFWGAPHLEDATDNSRRHLHQTRPLQQGGRSQAVIYLTRKDRETDNDGMYFGLVE